MPTDTHPSSSIPPPQSSRREEGEFDPSSGARRPDFFSELKRRKVYRVGVAYLAAVFGILQSADLVFPALGLGPRAFNGLVLGSLLGFPLVVVLAWTFDITAGGIRRTAPAQTDEGVEEASDRWARIKPVLVGAGFMGVIWLGVHLWQVPAQNAPLESIPSTRPVLAVLPFEDLSPGGDQAYFADGLHEELLHQLAVLQGIELRSRTSVEHFRGSPSKVSAIADSLGAGYVLEGSVRRAADSVRVTAQLIDGKTDQHLWSESYSRPLTVEGILALQQELALKLAGSLGGTLASGHARLLGRPPTRSVDAYNQYLLGLYHTHEASMDAYAVALEDFKRATQLDPDFGRAWGMLGLHYVLVLNSGDPTLSAEGMADAARAAAARGLALAPDEPEGHVGQLAVHWTLEWDWDGALKELEAILALNPDLVDAHVYMAEYWGVVTGDTDRALQELDLAIRLDPVSSGARSMRPGVLMAGRRYEEAFEAWRELYRMYPDNVEIASNLAWTLAWMGHAEESRAMDSLWLPHLRRPLNPGLASVFAWRGDTIRARAILDSALIALGEGRMRAAPGFGYAYLNLGKLDSAMTWFERAADEERYYAFRDPGLDPLVPDPRFQALWKRIGLKGERTVGRQPPAVPAPPAGG